MGEAGEAGRGMPFASRERLVEIKSALLKCPLISRAHSEASFEMQRRRCAGEVLMLRLLRDAPRRKCNLSYTVVALLGEGSPSGV